MNSTADSIKAWAQAPRPLKALTKEQLFKYPDADPSEQAYWEFSKELIARRATFDGLVIEHAQAERDTERDGYKVRSATSNLSKMKEELAAARENGDVGAARVKAELAAIAERALKHATETHARQSAKAAELKARLDAGGEIHGALSEDEVRAFYARRHAAEWNEIMAAWAEGTLMKAQQHGWGSFLVVKRGEQADDAKAFYKAEGLANLLGLLNGPTFSEIKALYWTRVMPPLGQRREFFVDGDPRNALTIAALKPATKAKYWAWWREYNTATKQHGWRDDGGDINDTRYFDPTQQAAEDSYDA